MAFPRSLDTKAMGEFVTRHFSWDRRGIAFPPSPLPKDFQTICPGFELVAEYYELPELLQVIFYTMLLNEAERLGVRFDRWGQPLLSSVGVSLSHGSGYLVTGSTKLDSTQRAVWGRMRKPGSGGKRRESDQCPRFLGKYGIPSYSQYERDGQLRKETFIWHWRSASRPPRPLPEDFHVLCPCFSLDEAEGAAAEFELPKIVQATFYAMLLNEAVKLGVAHEYMADSMKSSLVGLRWPTFEVWMDCMDCVVREAQLYRPADEVEA
ncbi:hypothetical protein Cgig2_005972 [Carnegiea gigantea]|uniref:Uncharacterized protein n=1 Tax=Carnegiea gigantea TaxID=171969 RepID=A0A9Q1QLI2_9CARY|nr:hypothetical protein Cgig2_005972 [Carnegiea gigantea]